MRPSEETCGVGGRIGRRGERGERCGAGDLLAIMACGTPARESKRTGAGASKQAIASQNDFLLPKRPRSRNDFYLGYGGSTNYCSSSVDEAHTKAGVVVNDLIY